MNAFKDNLQIDEDGDYNVKGFIKFMGKEFCIIDNFKYKEKKYFYIIEDKEKEILQAGGIENYKEDVSIFFIYEKEEGIYANVVDEELINELNTVFLTRIAEGKVINVE